MVQLLIKTTYQKFISIFKKSSTRQRLFLITFIVVFLWVYNIKKNFEPEKDFRYPLEVNMSHLVQSLKMQGSHSRSSIKTFYESLDVKPINVYYFTYGEAPLTKCISSKFVFIIKSSLKNCKNRELLRTYFQTMSSKVKFTFTWIFFVGQTSNFLHKDTFDDVVQVDFIDSYQNNTLKLCAEIFWLQDNLCRSSIDSRIIFIDDDVFINFDNLPYLLRPKFDRRAIFGHLYDDSSPYRMMWSKWFIGRDQYKYDFYPPYVSGSTIVMNRETLLEISFAIPYVKYLPFDDVYLGIVAKKLNLNVVNEEKILVDHKCGFFCKEDIGRSIAVHITRDFETLVELTKIYS